MKFPSKQLREELLQGITPQFKKLGFVFSKTSNAFISKGPSATWFVKLSFINHESDFDVFVSVFIRINALESLLHALEPKGSKLSDSLGAELGNIAAGKQQRWTIKSEIGVSHASNRILAAFSAIGLPYLKRYSLIENAIEIFSADDKYGWINCPIHDARAKRALACAFLLNDFRLFRELAEKKSIFLSNRNDPNLISFRQVEHTLEERFASLESTI